MQGNPNETFTLLREICIENVITENHHVLTLKNEQ